jgi:general secretion pathway protein D
MTATNSFFVPMSERLMLVVKDTEQKRREVENTVVLSVPIPEPFTVQEAQELGRTVQQVMEIQRFAIDSSQRLVIFRDRVSKARPAQVLFTQLLTARAQVAVDVELLGAATTSTLGLGLGIQSTFSILPMSNTMPLSGPFPQLALGITGANLLARATRSQSRSLYSASLRSSDGLPASLKVGEKYPIMTLGYVGAAVPGEGLAFAPPPTFNFEDLGLNIKVTPKVHDKDEVTLELEAEFKVISGTGTNGIPIISNRRFVTRARLKFDEAAVLSGLVTRNDFKTYTGLAGIPDIPFLGPLFGQTNWSKDDIQLLLVMRPRLLTLPPTEYVTHPIWTGSESRPRIPM